jgi:acyl carrier protein
MTRDTRLQAAFAEALGIEQGTVTDALAYNAIPEWDSIAHMALIARIEDTFGIVLDTDDVIDLSSVAKAREILGKYNINV